jgi:hypothetical protein
VRPIAGSAASTVGQTPRHSGARLSAPPPPLRPPNFSVHCSIFFPPPRAIRAQVRTTMTTTRRKVRGAKLHLRKRKQSRVLDSLRCSHKTPVAVSRPECTHDDAGGDCILVVLATTFSGPTAPVGQRRRQGQHSEPPLPLLAQPAGADRGTEATRGPQPKAHASTKTHEASSTVRAGRHPSHRPGEEGKGNHESSFDKSRRRQGTKRPPRQHGPAGTPPLIRTRPPSITGIASAAAAPCSASLYGGRPVLIPLPFPFPFPRFIASQLLPAPGGFPRLVAAVFLSRFIILVVLRVAIPLLPPANSLPLRLRHSPIRRVVPGDQGVAAARG